MFSGNVKLKFQDVIIICQRAVVYMNSESNKITRVIMTGGVKVLKDKSFFYGKKVTFNAETGKLIVEGNVYTKVKLPLMKIMIEGKNDSK